jgi:hypothetical protein
VNGRHYARCFAGIATREALRFVQQRERFVAALVRPLVWLVVFAAGFRSVLGVAILPPYDTYITYDVYIVPGLVGMIQLFNGMQSSLSMVYDREMGSMRTLLVSPLPRWFLLVCKLLAGTLVSILQVYAFLAVAWMFDIRMAPLGYLVVGELRRDHEFRHLPDVLPVLRALSAVEDAGDQPAALPRLRGQSLYPRDRSDPLCALRPIQRRGRASGPVDTRHPAGAGDLRLQPGARHDESQGRRLSAINYDTCSV